MITTPLSFHRKANGQVIDLVSKLYISFYKEKSDWITYFTLDSSVLNGGDILKSLDDNPIQLWDTYNYYDYSSRLISVSVERSIQFPYGVQCAQCDITLDNYDSYFDPTNLASNIAEYNLPSRPIKIYAGYNGETPVGQFVGLTQDMPTVNNQYGTVSYHSVDFLSAIANQTLNKTISMRNVDTSKVLAEIVEQFGVLPTQYDFETGSNVIPFVFFDKGENAGEAIRKLVQAEGGQFWLDETGILRFARRASFPTDPVLTLSDYSIISVEPSGVSDIVNRIKITCDLREVQEFQTVYSKKSTENATSNLWVVGPGASIIRECKLEDPCYDIVQPTLGKNSAVSYFTAKNVQGQEITSGIIASGELSTNAYTITFTNNNLFSVEIDEVQLWGEPAKVYDVLEYDAYDDDSVEKYGERVMEINDNKFFQSYAQAESYVVYMLNERSKYNNTLKLSVKGDFALQLGDTIALTGDYEGNYKVDAITWQMENGRLVYSLKVHGFEITDYFTLDKSRLDGTDVLA